MSMNLLKSSPVDPETSLTEGSELLAETPVFEGMVDWIAPFMTASYVSRIFSGIPLMKCRNSDSTTVRNCSDNLFLQSWSIRLISSESQD
jgi:hypothetical protein